MSNSWPTSGDDALIERYLQNDLTEEELNAFEIRMLEDSNLFVQLEAHAAFDSAMREHAPALDEPVKPPQSNSSTWQALLSAAAVLVVSVSVVVSMSVPIERHQMTLETFRSVGFLPTAPAATPISFKIYAAPQPGIVYDAKLLSQATGEVIEEQTLHAANDGSVSVNGAALNSGIYTWNLVDPAGQEYRFRFSVTE